MKSLIFNRKIRQKLPFSVILSYRKFRIAIEKEIAIIQTKFEYHLKNDPFKKMKYVMEF
jgi:hypothetical protein